MSDEKLNAPKLIVALTGSPGSGKTTIAEYLVGNGFTFFAISEIRRTVGLAYDIDTDNFEAMRSFNEEFYARRGRGIFTDFALRNIASRRAHDVVLDGLRYPESVHTARSFCTSKGWRLLCIGLNVGARTAAERISARGRQRDPQTAVTISEYAASAGRTANQALEHCDVVIPNEGTIEQLLERVDHLVSTVRDR